MWNVYILSKIRDNLLFQIELMQLSLLLISLTLCLPKVVVPKSKEWHKEETAVKADTPSMDFVFPVILSLSSYASAVQRDRSSFMWYMKFYWSYALELAWIYNLEILQTKLLFTIDFNNLVFCQGLLYALEKSILSVTLSALQHH